MRVVDIEKSITTLLVTAYDAAERKEGKPKKVEQNTAWMRYEIQFKATQQPNTDQCSPGRLR